MMRIRGQNLAQIVVIQWVCARTTPSYWAVTIISATNRKLDHVVGDICNRSWVTELQNAVVMASLVLQTLDEWSFRWRRVSGQLESGKSFLSHQVQLHLEA
jgi:hypothetical protein